MKTSIATLLILISSTTTFAQSSKGGLCDSKQSVIFDCPTESSKRISVCASSTPAEVQYRFGKAGQVELSLPGKKDKAASFNYLMYSGGGGAYVRFTSKSTQYIVYSRVVKGEGDSSGVLILQKNKKPTSVRCATQSDLDAPALEKLHIHQEEPGTDPVVDNL